MQNFPYELLTNFNDIEYFDDVHKYFINGQECRSVTTFIHDFSSDFDEDYWAEKKAEQFGISKYDVLDCWKFINEKGTTKGSFIHNYAENKLLNKDFTYPDKYVIDKFGFDPIKKEYELTKKHIDKFYSDTKNKLIPIKTEAIVYDEESLISGTFDILFYNVKMKEYQIWDWKTNKEFSTNSRNKMKFPISHLDDCDLETYSLQLNLYKYIIEKNTNIKISDNSYLVWVSHRNDSYQIIKTNNRMKEVNTLIKYRINGLLKIK